MKKGLSERKIFYFVLSIILLLYIGFILLVIVFYEDINFEPDKFLSEYAKFLGTLTIAILSFLTIQIYWQKKTDEIKRYNLYRDVDFCFVKIASYLTNFERKICKYLEKENKNPEEGDIETARIILSEYISKIKNVCETLSSYINKLDSADIRENNDYLQRKLEIYGEVPEPLLIQMIEEWESGSYSIYLFWKHQRENLNSLKIDFEKILEFPIWDEREDNNGK